MLNATTMGSSPDAKHTRPIFITDLNDDDTASSTDNDEYVPRHEKSPLVASVRVDPEPYAASGRLPEDVYERTLPPVRLALRKALVRCVEWESGVLGRWQVRLLLPFTVPRSLLV